MKKLISLSIIICILLLGGCANDTQSQNTTSYDYVLEDLDDFLFYLPIPSIVSDANDEKPKPIIDYNIRHDILKAFENRISIVDGGVSTWDYLYCGSYNGNVAIYTGPGIGQSVTVVKIEDIELRYPDTNEVIIWSCFEGNFYTMDVAYEKGLIDYEDIMPIYERYLQGRYSDKK